LFGGHSDSKIIGIVFQAGQRTVSENFFIQCDSEIVTTERYDRIDKDSVHYRVDFPDSDSVSGVSGRLRSTRTAWLASGSSTRLGGSWGGSGGCAWSVSIDAFSYVAHFVHSGRKRFIRSAHSGEKSRLMIGFSINPCIQR
jgi:hypothetical protein